MRRGATRPPQATSCLPVLHLHPVPQGGPAGRGKAWWAWGPSTEPRKHQALAQDSGQGAGPGPKQHRGQRDSLGGEEHGGMGVCSVSGVGKAGALPAPHEAEAVNDGVRPCSRKRGRPGGAAPREPTVEGTGH